MYEKNVRSDRQGFGLHPEYLNDVLGRKAIINPMVGRINPDAKPANIGIPIKPNII